MARQPLGPGTVPGNMFVEFDPDRRTVSLTCKVEDDRGHREVCEMPLASWAIAIRHVDEYLVQLLGGATHGGESALDRAQM